jgi:hypothetical protein
MTSKNHETPRFDPSVYPRTYQFSAGFKGILVVCGTLLLLFGAAGAARVGVLPIAILCALLALIGLYLAAAAIRYRVALSADSIDVLEFLRPRHLARADIAGYKRSRARGAAGWTLVPKPGYGRAVKISTFLTTDHHFSDWIRSLPNLDEHRDNEAAKERAAAIAALQARGYSGAFIAQLRRWGSRVVWLMLALAVVALVLPDPHGLLLWTLVALPCLAVALVARFQPLFRFGGPQISELPDLSPMLFVPGCLLILRVLPSIYTVNWMASLELAVLGSLALTGTACLADPWLRSHRASAVLVAILCLAFGYGAGLVVNARLDHAPAQSYRAKVISKHVSHGKSTTWHLHLAPWGPIADDRDITVQAWRYREAQPGTEVCLLLHEGALHLAWYELVSCSDSARPL